MKIKVGGDILSSTDAYFFHQGTHYRAYRYLGCTLNNSDGDKTYMFRTWAPSADAVFLVSDFCGWSTPIPMKRITERGIWEVEYRSCEYLTLSSYKFLIKRGKRTFYKGDPYARYSKGGDDGASLIFRSDFEWSDAAWLDYRRSQIISNGKFAFPLNIYELHLGSFLRHSDGSYYSYREYADVLVEYVKRLGFTHVEILPISEYPYDGSWGYQTCAFYAPTSRFGDPDDFKYLINALHNGGVGVILDWVGAHFPKDEWGIYEFDGGPLYEYQGRDRMESSSWGTRFFDLGREEVQSFLISNIIYYLDEFHIDGIRVDAVASMLYLDYDRLPGEWIPNSSGGNINPEAVAFLQKLNEVVKAYYPDVMTFAEESGSFVGVTHSQEYGGLGFDMKWNMGFANDLYEYLTVDPIFRKYKHKALTFPIMYAYDDRYCLPISHDEVVHGKRSFADKPHGTITEKLMQARLAYMLFMTFPGKKLTFMGTEYAQIREWDFNSSLEWFMLDFDEHKAFFDYVSSLNYFYLNEPALWESDYERSGFEWLLADECEKNCIAFMRKSKSGKELHVYMNFSGTDTVLNAPLKKKVSYNRVFETAPPFGDKGKFKITKGEFGYSASVFIPKFSGYIMEADDGTIKIEFKE